MNFVVCSEVCVRHAIWAVVQLPVWNCWLHIAKDRFKDAIMELVNKYVEEMRAKGAKLHAFLTARGLLRGVPPGGHQTEW